MIRSSRRPQSAASAFAAGAALIVLSTTEESLAQIAGPAFAWLQPAAAADGAIPNAFRSPFDADAGWWALVRSPEVWRIDLQYDEAYPLSRRLTGSDALVRDRALRIRLGGPLSGLPGRWWGDFIYEKQDFQTCIDASNTDLELRGHGEQGACGLRYQCPEFGLTLQGVLPAVRGEAMAGQAGGLGIRWEPGPLAAAQFAQTRQRNDNDVHLQILDTPIRTRLNAIQDANMADVRIGPVHMIEMDGSWREALYAYADAVSGAEQYELLPDGRTLALTGALRLHPWPRHELLARYREVEFDFAAGGYWGGQQFAWLNYARGEQISRMMAWRWACGATGACRIEWETNTLDAKARGSIESWPFTESIVDLLGIRQICRSAGQASWHRLTVAGGRKSGSCDVEVGISWFRMHPRAVLETWRPAFLVFGSADYRRDEMAVEQADILMLQLQVDWRVAASQLQLSLQQLAYGDVREAAVSPSPEPPPPEPHEMPAESGWYGGTWLSLAMIVPIG